MKRRFWRRNHRRSDRPVVWHEATSDQLERQLERQSQRLLGMPLDDVRAKHAAGVLPESAAADYLVMASGGFASRED